MVSGFLAPNSLSASFFGKKHKTPKSGIDGAPIVPITSGLGSTGDIYVELGVTLLVNINGTVNGHRRFHDEAGSHGTDSQRQRAFRFD